MGPHPRFGATYAISKASGGSVGRILDLPPFPLQARGSERWSPGTQRSKSSSVPPCHAVVRSRSGRFRLVCRELQIKPQNADAAIVLQLDFDRLPISRPAKGRADLFPGFVSPLWQAVNAARTTSITADPQRNCGGCGHAPSCVSKEGGACCSRAFHCEHSVVDARSAATLFPSIDAAAEVFTDSAGGLNAGLGRGYVAPVSAKNSSMSLLSSFTRSGWRFARLLVSPMSSRRLYSSCVFGFPNQRISLKGNGALFHNTNGGSNTATGSAALNSNVGGFSNTADGYAALINNTASFNTATGSLSLSSNTTGSNNTGVGYQALKSNTTGPFNTAVGESALASNTSGDRNTAIGDGAMIVSTTGFQNTAVGVSALRNNTTGAENVAVGQDACNNNGSATGNTGVGYQALQHNTATGSTALGFEALLNNTSGSLNTAIGAAALITNTTGDQNTAIGYQAMFSNTTGSDNTAMGVAALEINTTGSQNTATGFDSLASNTAGDNNTADGFDALSSNKRRDKYRQRSVQRHRATQPATTIRAVRCFCARAEYHR